MCIRCLGFKTGKFRKKHFCFNSKNNNPENDNEENYCNLWTSSATSLVLINLITIDEEYYIDNQLSNYYNVLIAPAIKSSKLVRAPPV